MNFCNHKTVFVLDHSPYFGISSEEPMEFDFSKSRSASVVHPPVSKSLWTSSIEAAIEYCRIVWDLFPEGKLIRFVASDTAGHNFNAWNHEEQNIPHILEGFAQLGIPPMHQPGHRNGDYSVIPGIRAAIEALTEYTSQQIALRSKSDGAKLVNRGRVICITSTRDNDSMKSLQEIFSKCLASQNKQASMVDHLIPVHLCHLVLINIYPLNGETAVTSQTPIDINSALRVEVHSVPAGKFLVNKLVSLILGHYGLASTTVTGIPMKEEQNASSSANYDVEIFHPVHVHSDLFRTAVTDTSLVRTRKENFDYDTVTLKWCTPRNSTTQELYHCPSVHRVTPVDVNSRPSSCLINFLLNGRSVMLEMPKRSGGKTISHILFSHGGDVFIHALSTGRVVLEDPPSISEGVGGRVTDYRMSDFGTLIRMNKLMPLKNRFKHTVTPYAKMCSRLDRQTKYWPITISGTFLLNLRQHIEPMPQLLAKEELTVEDIAVCRQLINDLVAVETKNESLVLPTTGVRGKPPKKDDQYKQMWNELEKLVRAHCRSESHHKVLQTVIELRSKDPDRGGGTTSEPTTPSSPTAPPTDNNTRASVIRATTDSPMSPPPCSSSKAMNISGALRPSRSIYSQPRTLLDIWMTKNAMTINKERKDFYGRATGGVAVLYPGLIRDDLERGENRSDATVIE